MGGDVEVQHPTPLVSEDEEHEEDRIAHGRFCRSHLRSGARALGAFDGDRLIGIGLMTPTIRPGVAQLAYLHVSREYRRGGVATRPFDELVHFAR